MPVDLRHLCTMMVSDSEGKSKLQSIDIPLKHGRMKEKSTRKTGSGGIRNEERENDTCPDGFICGTFYFGM